MEEWEVYYFKLMCGIMLMAIFLAAATVTFYNVWT